MAWLRIRKIRGRRYYICVTRAGQELAAGKNIDTARRVVAHYDNMEQLARHKIPMPKQAVWTLAMLRDKDTERNPEASRRRRWDVLLRAFGADTYLDQVTPETLLAYRERRGHETGPATVNRDMAVLRAALRRARDPGSGANYSDDPFAGILPLREPRDRRTPLTPQEVKRLIRAGYSRAAISPWHIRGQEWADNARIIEIAYLTASRISQVLAMRREQVSGGRLTFAGHKRGAPRVFRVVGRLAVVLRPLLKRDGWLFPSARGEGHRRDFRRFMRLACDDADVPRITPHGLRHAASSASFSSGAGIAHVQRLLGHTTPSQAIATYTALYPETMAPVGFHALSTPAGRKQPIRAARKRAKPQKTEARSRRAGSS